MNIPLILRTHDLIPPQAFKAENEAEARRWEDKTRCAECGASRPSRRSLWKHKEKTGHKIDL